MKGSCARVARPNTAPHRQRNHEPYQLGPDHLASLMESYYYRRPLPGATHGSHRRWCRRCPAPGPGRQTAAHAASAVGMKCAVTSLRHGGSKNVGRAYQHAGGLQRHEPEARMQAGSQSREKVGSGALLRDGALTVGCGGGGGGGGGEPPKRGALLGARGGIGSTSTSYAALRRATTQTRIQFGAVHVDEEPGGVQLLRSYVRSFMCLSSCLIVIGRRPRNSEAFRLRACWTRWDPDTHDFIDDILRKCN